MKFKSFSKTIESSFSTHQFGDLVSKILTVDAVLEKSTVKFLKVVIKVIKIIKFIKVIKDCNCVITSDIVLFTEFSTINYNQLSFNPYHSFFKILNNMLNCIFR